jgi:hypothetical protein
LAVGFFKGWTRFPFLFEMPPILFSSFLRKFCERQNIFIFENRKEIKERYRKFLVVLEYALPFTKFYRRNDENRIGGVSIIDIYFDSFSNSLGETVILNKSPVYTYYFSIFFHVYRTEKWHWR